MSESNTPPGAVAHALARGRVGSLSMISFVGAAAAPFLVVAALTSTAWAVTGFVAIPLVFLLIGAVLAVFAAGYTAMTRHVTNAGALYSYVTRGLGRPLGVGGAGMAMLAYNGLQVGLYGAFGTVTSDLARAQFGWNAPWWIWALLAWAVVTVLGLLRVDLNGRVLASLLTAEFMIMLVADAAMLANPAGGAASTAALAPASLATPAIGAAIVVTATAFVGFEAPTVYAEEARDPQRSIPLATFAALAVLAGLYALSSWALTVTIGPGSIVTAAQEQGPDLLFNAIGGQLGTPVSVFARVLLITSMFAGMLAFHNTVARYAFALGRERVLPAVLGRTAPRSGAPRFGSLAQSALGLIVISTFALAGLDPMVALFFTLGTGGGLGVLLLITLTSIGVVVFFARHPQRPSWRTRVLPVLAAVLLVVGSGLALVRIDTLLGVPPGSLLTWLIPLVYLGTLLAGGGWALVLRSRKPAVYAAVGHGADTAPHEPVRHPQRTY